MLAIFAITVLASALVACIIIAKTSDENEQD